MLKIFGGICYPHSTGAASLHIFSDRQASCCLGTSDAVLSAAPPSRSLPADDLYYEVVEARLGDGLYYTQGGQKVRFGDTPQVCPGMFPHPLS